MHKIIHPVGLSRLHQDQAQRLLRASAARHFDCRRLQLQSKAVLVRVQARSILECSTRGGKEFHCVFKTEAGPASQSSRERPCAQGRAKAKDAKDEAASKSHPSGPCARAFADFLCASPASRKTKPAQKHSKQDFSRTVVEAWPSVFNMRRSAHALGNFRFLDFQQSKLAQTFSQLV